LALNIIKKLDVNDSSIANLTSILLLHYFVKCRSHSSAMIYDDEFMADNAGIVALPIFAIVTVLDGVYCR